MRGGAFGLPVLTCQFCSTLPNALYRPFSYSTPFQARARVLVQRLTWLPYWTELALRNISSRWLSLARTDAEEVEDASMVGVVEAGGESAGFGVRVPPLEQVAHLAQQLQEVVEAVDLDSFLVMNSGEQAVDAKIERVHLMELSNLVVSDDGVGCRAAMLTCVFKLVLGPYPVGEEDKHSLVAIIGRLRKVSFHCLLSCAAEDGVEA